MKKALSFLLVLFIVVVILIAWWFLYQKTQDVDRSKHYQVLTVVNELKRLDTELTLQVILLRLASNNNYDELSNTIDVLETKEAFLDGINIIEIYQSDGLDDLLARLLNKANNEELDNNYLNKHKNYQSLYRKKASLVRQFKLSNGALTNSINFIPIATDEVINQSSKESRLLRKKLKIKVKELLLLTLKYAQFSNQENLEFVKEAILDLQQFEVKIRKEEVKDSLVTLLRHVNTIIEKKVSVSRLLKKMATVSPSTALDHLTESFVKLNEQRLANVADYRLALVIFSALLVFMLAIAGYFIWRSYHKLQLVNQTLEKRVTERTVTLSSALEKLKDSQAHLVQSEKMASLGQMVAGVAHEINTPLGYVKSNVELIQDMLIDIKTYSIESARLVKLLTSETVDEKNITKKLHSLSENMDLFIGKDPITTEVDGFVNESLLGLETINELVLSLKNFSRLDKAAVNDVDIHECINSTLLVAKNKLKDVVLVKKQFSRNMPKIKCSPSQINQVLLNLIVNASQAMPKRDKMGTVTIRTLIEGEYLLIKVLDNGNGIPEQILQKIFDPFYTTKAVGEGTGLGLSISYKIIQEHKGKLLVSSIEGKGTQFTIALPLTVEETIENKTSSDNDELEELFGDVSMFGDNL